MKVLILAGAPGSGKSTWIRKWAYGQPVQVVSADDFFEVNGIYQFDPTKIGEAHASCLFSFVNLLQNSQILDSKLSSLVVDNTNTTLVEWAPYIRLAQAYRLPVQVLVFSGRYKNLHGCPDDKVEALRQRLQLTLEADVIDFRSKTFGVEVTPMEDA